MHQDGSVGETVRADVNPLLRAWSDGDPRALAQLTPIVYGELRPAITVMREWKTAKAWLYRELTGRTGHGSLGPRR